MNAVRLSLQAVAYGTFILLVGILSNSPRYQRLDNNEALIRLAFSHFGQPIRECRRLTQDELNALPPNMRKPTDCPRQRLPVQVSFWLDAQQVFQSTIAASGLSGDGEVSVYQRFAVSAGPHRLQIKMRDTARSEGFDYQLDEQVTVKAMENLVIGFDPNRKQFVIRRAREA